MDIEALVHINKTKKDLLKNRQQKIRKKIVQVNKEKLATNRPQKRKLPVYIRSKVIQKKDFKTVVEKTKAKEVLLQDNVNANTFVYESEKYQRILKRTKEILGLDEEKVKESCLMLLGFGKERPQEKNLYVRVTFENPLKCMLRPVQIEVPYPGVGQRGKSILITEYGKTKQQEFEEIKHLNVDIYSWGEFQGKMKDQNFKKVALKPTTKLFCDFKIYTKIENSYIFNEIISKNVIFPIENDYVEDLVNHSYFVTKSQQQYLIRICKFKQLTAQQLTTNALSCTLQIISRLLQKNKHKNSRVSTIQLKTDNSILVSIH